MSSSLREGDRVKPIVAYLEKNLAKGYKPQDLKWALVKQGYSRIEVDKALKHVEEIRALRKPASVPMPEPKVEIMPEPEEKKSFWKKLFG
jgi:hypothetical protein